MSRSERHRVLAVFRHPTPYRDPLLDRVARLPGLDLHVLYLARSFSDTPWEAEAPCHSHSFPRGWLHVTIGAWPVAVHPRALAELVGRRPDACVLSGWGDPTVLALVAACRVLRIPYALAGESHGEGRLRGAAASLRDVLVGWVIRGARSWLPAGTRAKAHFVRLGADPARCHFNPTSPDAERWTRTVDGLRSATPSPRERLGLPPDGVLVFVGRLMAAKGVDVLLDAFALLRGDRPALRLLLVGDGPLRMALEAHPVARHVDFLGFRQPRDVAEVLAASDVFVLPSRQETWGAAACEALAAGLPVVLGDGVGAADDLVVGGDTGAVVPAGDSVALAAALGRVLDDPDRRVGLPERARLRSVQWGHDLNIRSVVAALRDCGLDAAGDAAARSGDSAVAGAAGHRA